MNNAKKLLITSLLAATAGTSHAANSFDQAIKNASISGELRLGYIAVSPDVAGATDTSAGAVGGHIKLESADINGFQFAFAPYFVEKVNALSGDEEDGELNGEFFDDNNASYAYIGEAYVNYAFNNGSFRWGRQAIDTPFINTDNIRMLPHTYQAAWLRYNPSEKLHLEGGIAKKWAGVGSGGNPGKFKPVSEDGDGALALGGVYQVNEAYTAQGWFYDFDNNFSLLYADVVRSRGPLELAAQFASYSEDNDSGVDGSAWGLMASYNLEALTFTAAYNESSNPDGKAVSVGLCGCGSFYTSMDEINIAEKNDASAYLLAVDYAVNDALTATLATAHFEDADAATADIDETNIVLSYAFSDQLDAEFIHANVENDAAPADEGTNFSRNLLRVSYNF
jgi:hypothetical protein